MKKKLIIKQMKNRCNKKINRRKMNKNLYLKKNNNNKKVITNCFNIIC